MSVFAKNQSVQGKFKLSHIGTECFCTWLYLLSVFTNILFHICRYGIRGIPAVVIIDAISGVVISQEHVRNDIMRGCQRGDKGVVDSYNHWLTLIPEESKMIVQSIQLSLQEEAKMLHERDSSKTNPYLVRQVPEVKPKDPSEVMESPSLR
jgi:hypothetical protein